MASYRDLGGSQKAAWLDSWKKTGMLKVWLHKEPPWMRTLHNFRRVQVEETRDGIVKKILWLPFVCWETEEYHKLRRFKEPRPATTCPACKLIEHLEKRDDLADDEVIFTFTAGRERRDLRKVDLIGKGESRSAYQDDLTAKTDYLIAVIPEEKPDGVYLTNEKWSLGAALAKRIERDMKLLGEEDGDPSRKPICYTFEFDKDSQKYSVSRYPEAKLSDAVLKHWEGPGPDANSAINRGNPKTLLEAMKVGLQIELPLDDFFAAAIASWSEKDATDFDHPEETEAEGVEAKGDKGDKKGSAAKPPKETKPKEPAAKPPKEEAKPEPKPAAKEEPKKQTRAAAKPEPKPEPPPPPPEPEETIYACEVCGADWPESKPACPNCGATPSGDAAPTPGSKF